MYHASRKLSSGCTPLFGDSTGGTLRLVEPAWFALRTDHDTDPLRAVLGAAGGLDSDEHAVVQVLARPAPTSRLAQARRAARALRTGNGGLLDRLASLALVAPTRPSDDPSRTGDVRAILAKAASPAWAVTIRYGVSTKRRDRDTEPELARAELRTWKRLGLEARPEGDTFYLSVFDAADDA